MAETPLSPDPAPGENAAVDATAAVDVAARGDGEGAGDNSEGEAPWTADGSSAEGSWQQAPAEATPSASLDGSLSAAEAAPQDMTEPLDSDVQPQAAPEAKAPWSTPAPTPPWGTASTGAATAPAVSQAAAPPAESLPPVEPQVPVEPLVAPPGIATTIAVPPLETGAGIAGEGGEWELLVGKLNAWFSSGELNRQWQRIRGPLKGVALLIAAILALRLYATVVGSIDRIPVVSGLLELTGLIALVHFGLTRMVRTQEREQVLASWKQHWQAFLGQD